MSDMSSGTFTLTHESLSADCTSPQPDFRGTRDGLDESAVRACLEAFAAIPAVELTEVDAKIQLRHHQRQVAVYHSGNALYFTPIPEASHTPTPGTPDEVLAYLTGTPAVTAEDPAVTADGATESKPTRRGLGLSFGAQIAVLAVLVSILAGLYHYQLGDSTPADYVPLKEAAQIKALHQQYDGDYGDPSAADGLSFKVSGNNLQIFSTGPAGTPRTLVRSESFRYALRAGDRISLIGNNGDILEFNPDGSLLFGETSYPRNSK